MTTEQAAALLIVEQSGFAASIADQSCAVMKSDDGLPATGFVRLSQILAPSGPIPVSKSTWWAGVAAGRYPNPIKLGAGITAWCVEDV